MELDEAIEAVRSAQDAADRYLEEHPGLPRSNALSISNGIGQSRFLLSALQRARGAEEAAAEKERARAAAIAAPKYDEHEIRSTERLIELGHLPAGSTPADFRALQEKRRSEGGQRGAVSLPTGGAE